MDMKKTAHRSTKTRKITRASGRKVSRTSSLLMGNDPLWGKDQQMLITLSAGIILLIVVGMYFGGWL